MIDNGGATFGGVAFSSLGLLVTKANIPLLPETRQSEEEIPGLDGTIDLLTEYGPRMIELEVTMLASDETDYQIRLQKIAKVFNARAGVKPLILDRMTGKRWMCKYNGQIPIEKMATLGTFTLPFKAFFPFSESVTDTGTPIAYGQGYTYGMGFRYGGGRYSFLVTSSPKALVVYHAGTHEAYPVIRLTGSGSNITIRNETTGEQCTLSVIMAAGDVVEVRCAPLEQVVIRNGTDITRAHSGIFPRLVEGDNNISITATAPSLTVAFIFRHTYLY
ncbi:phage tail family protein [Cohnella xylanilytica]|uniref:Phage tail family protein n=1 Tax=Cohnella xylanilytica TaxID=557555 RepID=A0A841TWB8_9BACL|nr:distal tail protein Dit [Cohnella xylanilytica]MBB6689904.1 phage tail family protein [Cohnella xylanilytica]